MLHIVYWKRGMVDAEERGVDAEGQPYVRQPPRARTDHTCVCPSGASAEILGRIEAPATVVFDHVDDGMHTPGASRSLALALANCKEVIVGERQQAWLPRAVAMVNNRFAEVTNDPAS